MRTIIIGDIHGCDKALRALLEKAAPDEKQDRLILLGDLFDRGPDSRQVLQTVKALEEQFAERFVLLRGNHEDYLLQPKLTFRQKRTWARVGRQAAVDSFRQYGERMEDCIPWMKTHCRLFWRGEELQCVHAGILMDPIEVNDAWTMIHDHETVLRNRYTGPLTVTGHIALKDAMWFAGDGKTAEKLTDGEKRRLPGYGVICIDTGCGKGGRLTAMTVENGEYILDSVPES